MFILLVSRGYAGKDNPLLGIFEMDQAKALQNAGHKVIVAAVDLRSIRRRRKLGFDHLFHDGIEIYNFSFPLGAINKKILLFVGQMALVKLYNQVKRRHGKPDIIHAHFLYISAIAIILKRKYTLPIVITEHGSYVNKESISKSIKKLGDKIYHHADIVISVSTAVSKKLLYHFNINSHIIPNIVDVQSFVIRKNTTPKFTFISVGNLVGSKKFDVLIDAFKMANFSENVILKIIGQGIEQQSLQKRINNFNLNNQIFLMGYLTRKEINNEFNKSNVFVLSSQTETFGVVYAEAMLTGIPVIATKCGGPEDFVDKTNGLLVEVDDVKELCSALKFMYINSGNYCPEIIRNKIIDRYSPENIAKQLGEIYEIIRQK